MVQLYNKKLFVASALFFTSCTSKNLFATSTKWKKWCYNPVNPDHADSVKLYCRQDVCYNKDGSMFFIFGKFKYVITITLSWFNEISVSGNYIINYIVKLSTDSKPLAFRSILALQSITELVLLIWNCQEPGTWEDLQILFDEKIAKRTKKVCSNRVTRV